MREGKRHESLGIHAGPHQRLFVIVTTLKEVVRKYVVFRTAEDSACSSSMIGSRKRIDTWPSRTRKLAIYL